MPHFRIYLVLLALAVFGSPMCSAGKDESSRPNILFFFVDDLNTELGTYGNRLVKSPNIDSIAASGVRFDRAYCQFPLCLPSRSSLLTGMRPETTRVLANQGNFRNALPNAVTLPQYFRKHGYKVVSVGKIYHPPGQDDPPSWDTVLPSPAGTGDYRRLIEERAEIAQVVERKPQGKGTGEGFLSYWGPLDCRDEETRDGMIARNAVEFLEKNRSFPFFLAVGFHKPHLPCIAPKKYFDL